MTTLLACPVGRDLDLLGPLTIIVAHHMYAMPPYPYIRDAITQLSCRYSPTTCGLVVIIVGLVPTRLFALIRDTPPSMLDNVLDRFFKGLAMP